MQSISWVAIAGALACSAGPRGRGSPPAPAASPVTHWIADHAVTLATLEPGHDLSDLSGVAAMVGDARVVGLGEPNHGAHEIFLLKHRLVELLVGRGGFDVFALEADYAACEKLNDYVMTGAGDPGDLLANTIGHIPWDTREMLALVLWMRRWNADPARPRKLQFYGFDAQRPVEAIRLAMAYLRGADAGVAAVFEARLAPLASYQAAFAYAGAAVAVQEATRAALDDLLAQFDRAPSGDPRWRRARQAVRTAQQSEQQLRGLELRDRHMADNLIWLAEQRPAARIIVWAHNGHLDFADPMAMGTHLRARFGPAYFHLATAFAHGELRAARMRGEPGEGWRVFSLGAAPAGSLEPELAATGRSAFVVDLRPASGDVARWLDTPRPFRTATGSLFDDRAQDAGFEAVAVRRIADAIGFVETTTAARPNPWSWQNQAAVATAIAPRNLDWREGAAGGPPAGWTVLPGGEPAVRVEERAGVRSLVIAAARADLATVQQSVAAGPGAGSVVVSAAVQPTAATAWLWLRGEWPGGALTIRKLALLRPGPDGRVQIKTAVPAGTSTLHFGITSTGDAMVEVGELRFERAD